MSDLFPLPKTHLEIVLVYCRETRKTFSEYLHWKDLPLWSTLDLWTDSCLRVINKLLTSNYIKVYFMVEPVSIYLTFLYVQPLNGL